MPPSTPPPRPRDSTERRTSGAPREVEPVEPRKSPLNLDKIFRTALIVIPIGVLGNIIFSLVATDQEMLGSLHAFPRHYLLLAIALGLLPWFTNALRLLIWTRFLGHRLPFRECFQITLGMDLGAAVSPTAVGGGFFKWGMLVQRGVTPGAAASLITLPNLEDALFFALALPTAIYLSSAWDLPVFRQLGPHLRENLSVLLPVVFVLLFVLWLLARVLLSGGFGIQARERGVKWLGRARRRLRVAWHEAREVFRLIAVRGKSRFAVALVLTGIGWTARYSVITALAFFLGVPVDPVLFFLLQWVVFSLMTLIPTPGAAGGAEAMFYFIYGALLPERVLGLATAGWRFLTFYLQLGLASILFTALNLRASRKREG